MRSQWLAEAGTSFMELYDAITDVAWPSWMHALNGARYDLAEFAFAHGDRIGIAAAFAVVHHEVLRGRKHAFLLDRCAEGDTHPRLQERILPVRLADPSPAHIARDVHDGRQDLADPACARFLRDHRGDPSHELRVPGGRESDGLRETRDLRTDESMERLIMEEDRDAEAGLIDGHLLDSVDAFRGHGCREPPEDGADAADAVGREVRPPDHLLRRTPELGDLLFEGHPGEQVGHARVDGRGALHVGRAGCRVAGQTP